MKVSEVMSRDVVTTTPEMTVGEAAALLIRRGISGVPVVDAGGALLGVLSKTDLVARAAVGEDPDGALARLVYLDLVEARKLEAHTAGEAMTSPAITIDSEQSVEDAARRMLKQSISRLPVVEGDRLVGIVTRADVVRTVVRA
jgi:CBS domain-containing protein